MATLSFLHLWLALQAKDLSFLCFSLSKKCLCRATTQTLTLAACSLIQNNLQKSLSQYQALYVPPLKNQQQNHHPPLTARFSSQWQQKHHLPLNSLQLFITNTLVLESSFTGVTF